MITEEEIDEIGLVLEHGGMSDNDIDTYFAHHGVKGMKWGERRKRNKELNKVDRNKSWAKQKKDVEKAQAFVKSGKHKEQWKDAKRQYKNDKREMGSRAARRIMNEKKVKINETYYKSQEAKSRKQQTTRLLLLGAGVVSVAAIQAAAHA